MGKRLATKKITPALPTGDASRSPVGYSVPMLPVISGGILRAYVRVGGRWALRYYEGPWPLAVRRIHGNSRVSVLCEPDPVLREKRLTDATATQKIAFAGVAAGCLPEPINPVSQ